MTPLPVEPLEPRQLLAYQYIDFGAGLSVTDVNATGQILVEANPDRTYYLAGPNRYAARSLGLNPALNVAQFNDNGVVAGKGPASNNKTHAKAWFLSPKNAYYSVDLGTLPSGGTSVAQDVNNANLFVGSAFHPSPVDNLHATYATVKKGKATTVDLNNVTAGRGTLNLSFANDVNDLNQIAVMGFKSGEDFYSAYLVKLKNGAGLLTKLPALGGATAASAVYRVNENGLAVGNSAVQPNGRTVATLWNPRKSGVVVTKIGTLGGETSSANGINDKNVVVGSSDTTAGTKVTTHGFMWTPKKTGGGTLTDLNTLLPKNSGLTITQGIQINNNGQIVARATDKKGLTHAVLLYPKTTSSASTLTNGPQSAPTPESPSPFAKRDPVDVDEVFA